MPINKFHDDPGDGTFPGRKPVPGFPNTVQSKRDTYGGNEVRNRMSQPSVQHLPYTQHHTAQSHTRSSFQTVETPDASIRTPSTQSQSVYAHHKSPEVMTQSQVRPSLTFGRCLLYTLCFFAVTSLLGIIINAAVYHHYIHRSLPSLVPIDCPDRRLDINHCHAPMALVRSISHTETARNWISNVDTDLMTLATGSNSRFPTSQFISERLNDQMRWASYTHRNATILAQKHRKLSQDVAKVMAGAQRQLRMVSSPTFWDQYRVLQAVYDHTFGRMYPSTYQSTIVSHVLLKAGTKILELYSAFSSDLHWDYFEHASVIFHETIINAQNAAWNVWTDQNLINPALCRQVVQLDVCSTLDLASAERNRPESPAIQKFFQESKTLWEENKEDMKVEEIYRRLQQDAVKRLRVTLERNIHRAAREDSAAILGEQRRGVGVGTRVFDFDDEEAVDALRVLDLMGLYTRTGVDEGARMTSWGKEKRETLRDEDTLVGV